MLNFPDTPEVEEVFLGYIWDGEKWVNASAYVALDLSGWSRVPLGPGGFISGIEMHPDGTKILRMDTSGAYIWNSTASRWDMLLTTDTLPPTLTEPGYGTNCGAYEIAIAPSDSSRFYIAWQHLAQYHVIRSTDQGVWFTATNFFAQNPSATFDGNGDMRGAGKKMAVHPTNPDIVIFGSTAGVHLTTNGGTTWTTVSTSQIPASDNGTYLFAFDPTGSPVYASSNGNGLYKSTNGGTTWSLAGSSGPITFWDMKVASTGTVWVVKRFISFEMEAYRLVGSTWTSHVTGTAGDNGYQLRAIAIDPANANHLVTTTEHGRISVSANNGSTWTGYGFHHTDFGAIDWLDNLYDGSGSFGLQPGATMSFDPAQSNVLYLGHGLGLCKGTPPSTLTTMNWTDNSIGLEQLCAKRLNKPAGNPDILLAVMDQGIFNCDGINYPATKGVLPYFSAAWDCDSCPSDPDTVVALINQSQGGPWDQSGVSRDGGNTWAPFGSSVFNSGVNHSGGMIACGVHPDNFIVVCGDNGTPTGLYYTTNGGAAWTLATMPAGIPSTGDTGWLPNYYYNRHTICGDRVTSGTFYGRNNNVGFVKSVDAGATWTVTYPIVGGTFANARLVSVPGNAGHLLYASGSSGNTDFGGAMTRSTNGGTSWSSCGTGEVLCMGFGKHAPGETYPAIYIVGWVGGTYGIYRSDDSCASWVQIGDFPLGCFDTPIDITGNLDVYGDCYMSAGASGIFKYRETGLSDPDGIPLLITSFGSVSVNENAVLAHSLTASKTVTWSIVGGADAARLELSGSTLRWTSNGTKDFEAPNDADANNIYVVTVRATDAGSLTVDQTISVTVLNVGGEASAEATAFLARTSGLDATHTNAYTALIDGLVADGVWAKFDVLHIYATQNTATAQLNLVSTSYPATLNGSPAFTTDRGYTGVDASATVYINTGFNPTTAPSPKHTNADAHISCWNLTNTTSAGGALGANTTITQACLIYPKYTDNNAYFRVNPANNGGNIAISDPRGHLIGSRTASNLTTGYQNGSSIMTSSQNAVGLLNWNFYVLSSNQAGTVSGGAWQLAMASIGAGLNSTQAAAFYSRLRTYLMAVGAVANPAAEFLARTSGLDATHTNAYTALINGLVIDGIWDKLDMLHVYATQDSATALLNLVSTSYNGTINGSPTFTADRGFTGVHNSSTVYINTGFNATTAPSPKYTQNSAHLSAWSLTSVQSRSIIGVIGGGESRITPRDGSNQAYFPVNSVDNSGQWMNIGDGIGHYVANRSNSTSVQGYKGGSLILNATGKASVPTTNRSFPTLGQDDTTWNHEGSSAQCAMASIGSSLDATQAAAFYNRLRTYMTAVGVP